MVQHPQNSNVLNVLGESEYLDLAEVLLRSVEVCSDRINDNSDADIDAQRVGGMVTLVFANRSQIVVNTQKPLREIWLAAKSGGFHYRYQEGVWRDSKNGGEFFTDLTRVASIQAAQLILFEQV